MEKIDVSGLSCPVPVIRTKKIMDAGAQEIMVTGSSQVSKENISKLAKQQGYQLRMIKDGKNEWEMELKKG
ncbi:MAG TPA: SirA family protein [Syntrophomonadaceae bacterium]|nr:SirA family protein [Syntrophomonadaceae bacterium]